MSKKQTYTLIIGLFIIWLLVISVFRANLSNNPDSIRWFNDHNDRWIYMLRGEWFPNHSLPYLDVPSEYPQIPTYLFGLIYLVVPAADIQSVYFLFSSIFSLLMIVFLFFTIRLLYKLLSIKWLAYLMLLPGTFYFTYNRFDILPALISLWSFSVLLRKKYVMAGIFLGIGALTKWYPALLLPVYLSYGYFLQKRFNWKLFAAFVITCLVISLPTLLTGGLDSFLSPYLIHAERGLEQVSLPNLLNLFFSNYGLNFDTNFSSYIFLVLQFLPAFLSLFVVIDSEQKIILWSIFIIGSFILFSRIFSPQWIIWLLPFLILAASNWYDYLWIILYNLVIYLTFPLAVDMYGIHSLQYEIGGIIINLIIMVALGISYSRANVKFSWNFFDQARKKVGIIFHPS